VRLVGHLEHRRRPPVTGPTRAERLAGPPVREALRQVTADRGGCIRPAQLRRTDTSTGERTSVLVPCGSVLEAICPACARRARTLRATQCREGWHLDTEPDLTPAPPDDGQQFWLTLRAEAQVRRDAAADAGEDTADLDAVIEELDAELTAAGLRGTLTRTTGQASSGGDGQDQAAKSRRSRSTRRRQDAPDLPRRQVSARTTGKVYRAPDGRTYRPSMFLTLTCDSYGRVRDDGTFGFGPGACSFRVTYAEEAGTRTAGVMFGVEGEGGTYARLDGDPAVFVAPRGLVQLLTPPFLDRHALVVDPYSIAAIEVTRRGAKRTLSPRAKDDAGILLGDDAAGILTETVHPGPARRGEGFDAPIDILVRLTADAGRRDLRFSVGAPVDRASRKMRFVRVPGVDATLAAPAGPDDALTRLLAGP
jgi:hypothetical protein